MSIFPLLAILFVAFLLYFVITNLLSLFRGGTNRTNDFYTPPYDEKTHEHHAAFSMHQDATPSDHGDWGGRDMSHDHHGSGGSNDSGGGDGGGHQSSGGGDN
jgi:uncharacterized membrane protein YgcG